MIKKPNPIPAFATEAEERKFWESQDSIDYVDWSKAGAIRLPNLKSSSDRDVAPTPFGPPARNDA